MAKTITSTDWHLEGVSVEARKLVSDYANLMSLPGLTIKQGEVVNNLILEAVPEKIKEHFYADFTSDGPNPRGATDGC